MSHDLHTSALRELPHGARIFTSLRYDPLLFEPEINGDPSCNFVAPSPFYMLAFHRDRMLEAAQHFGCPAVEHELQDGRSLHFKLVKAVDAWRQKECKSNLPLKVLKLDSLKP